MTIEKTKLGLPVLDDAVGGVYFNLPTLVQGRRGSGKTILAAHFADKVLRTGERLLFFCESAPEAVLLDARTAGFDFETPAASGQLVIVPVRTAFEAGRDGAFPFAEALRELRSLASRASASFAVFSSVVPWLAAQPTDAMPARVESFLSALSASSLPSLLLVHQPASGIDQLKKLLIIKPLKLKKQKLLLMVEDFIIKKKLNGVKRMV